MPAGEGGGAVPALPAGLAGVRPVAAADPGAGAAAAPLRPRPDLPGVLRLHHQPPPLPKPRQLQQPLETNLPQLRSMSTQVEM